jgi:hypothetical protein
MSAPPFVDPWLPAASDGYVPTVRPAIPITVYRITGSGTLSYTALPSVRCMAVEEHEGPAPASAMFRYAFDGRDPASPQSMEQALSTTWTGAGVVAEGDRLGVSAEQPDGTAVWIFDGFALTWKLDISDDTELVTMAAVGVAKRAWDTPNAGMLFRNSQAPETVSDVPTSLPASFNPRGIPNASPSTADSGSGSTKYPVFMDQYITGTDGSSNLYPRIWDLNMAVAYTLFRPMAQGGNGEEAWIQNPTRSFLDGLLLTRLPITGTPFDPTNSSTYTTSAIQCPDTPHSGRFWPVLLHELIRDSGFGMRFKLTTTGGGDPLTVLDLWLRQARTAKPILLPARGSAFDPQWCNMAGARIARDLTGCVTAWTVRGGLTRYEVSVILTPGFASNAADAVDIASMQPFDSSDPAFASTDAFNAYRVFVLDEDGSGHYAPNSATLVSGTPTSLDAVLGAPVSGVPQYAARRRAPLGQLLTVDSEVRPLRARLAISTNYAGTKPGIWDGTGTWQHVTGGWDHIKDRIGIRLDDAHPNQWFIGKDDTPGHPFPSGLVGTIELMNSAAPFWLRYTCVFEADAGLAALADLSSMGPLSRTIIREVDARDRYLIAKVHGPSEFNSTFSDVTMRDDSLAAMSEAVALRTATEAGVMEGHIVIPRFTGYYDIGDRISQIQGRNLGLRTDSAGAGYAAVYPVVVSRRWELDGGQKTTLTISDSGLNRRKYATGQPHTIHLAPTRTVRLNRPAAAPSQGLSGGSD